jgi:hypothetical protein
MEQSVKDEFLKPGEFMSAYPDLQEYFTPNDIGYLFKMKLVRGRKLNRGCEVSTSDILKLVAYCKVIKAA